VLAKASSAHRLDAVRRGIHAHAGDGPLHDDISLVLVGAA